MDTEGKKLSELDPLTLPVRASDLTEFIRKREDDLERYRNFRAPVAAGAVKEATTSQIGKARLATLTEVENAYYDSVVTPQGLEQAIADLLANRILGAGTVTVMPDVGFTTISKGDVLEEGIKIFGRFRTDGLIGALAEGQLPAIGVEYDMANETVMHIYQRPRLRDGGVDLNDFVITAIEGNYAICIEHGIENGRCIVVPYVKDEAIKLYDDWLADDPLTEGADFDAIYAGDDTAFTDVVMVEPGKFILMVVNTALNGTLLKSKIVDYSSPLSISSVDLPMDIPTDTRYSTLPTRCAIDMANPEYAALQFYYEPVVGAPPEVVPASSYIYFSTAGGGIDDSGFMDLGPSFDYQDHSAMYAITAATTGIPGSFFSLVETDFPDSRLNFAYKEIRTEGDATYGSILRFKPHTDRGVSDDGDYRYDTFVDLPQVEVDLVPLFTTKLTSLGYTVLDGVYTPGIGAITTYVPMPYEP